MVWDVALQDDEFGDTLLFNSVTGDYKYTRCSDGVMRAGRGAISRTGCLLVLRDDPRVTATVDRMLSRGSATIRLTPLGPVSLINDGNILNNTGACP
jgi:hypothetical protein